MKRSLLLGFALAAAGAHAQGLGPAASQFNAFIFGNATLNQSDSFGPVAVGGALTLNNYQINARNMSATLGTMTPIGLLVGGSVQAIGGAARVERGNAYVAGAVAGSLLFNGGSLVQSGVNTSSFATQLAFSNSQSQAIANMTATNIVGGGPAWPNVLNLSLAGAPTTPEGQQVLRINASLINSNPNVVLNLTGGSSNKTVIIDVVGGTSLNWSWVTNYTYENKLLWNFNGFSSITIGRAFDGSILAPAASITQNEVMEGQLIARTWNSNQRELHWANGTSKFDGVLPVPEPATLGALGVGFAAVLRRRRR